MWKSTPDQLHQPPHFVHRLRRLGRHADPRMRIERKHIGLVEHDVEPIEITGQAADFNMIALPDDHHVVAVAREDLDGAMRDAHQRTGRFDHRQSQRAGTGEGSIGGAWAVTITVGSDLRNFLGDGVPSACRAETLDLHEVTEDRQRACISMGVRKLDRIANAEAHAEVNRAKDLHALQFKVYCHTNGVKFASLPLLNLPT